VTTGNAPCQDRRAASGGNAGLEALRFDWGDAYRIGVSGAEWNARRRDGRGGELTSAGPDDLRAQIIADYSRQPVPRDLP
jgi:hypothetical protein